jgi:3-hydroxybutyryl-CoA dehydrogenase
MAIKKAAVIGAGQMGGGIIQVFATYGYDTVVWVRSDASEEKAKAKMEKYFNKQASKGKMSEEDAKAAIDRISYVQDYAGLADVDIVVEAASENMDLKAEIFRALDENCKPECILATNTSSLPITEIAAVTKRPEQVVGMHFMNPVPVMKLVEIIRGLETTDEVYQAIEDMSKDIGKVPVEVNDFPGFVSNRVLQVMINEAIFCFYEGVAEVEAIDTVMKLGMNHPMGPLELADLIGLDTVLAILRVLYNGYADSKYRPCPLLVQYVAAQRFGRKNGRGFYDYSK